MIRFITCLIALVMLIPVANAEEKSFGVISCRSGTITLLSASKELTVYSAEIKGINLVSDEDKTFENFTHRCIGVARVMGGEQWADGYCKYMDPEGDFFIVGYNGPGGGKPTPWEFIQGTGKWKGIKGAGTAQTITRGKPIVEGTFQFCSKITGTYELPQ
jgi:hypothetical protein